MNRTGKGFKRHSKAVDQLDKILELISEAKLGPIIVKPMLSEFLLSTDYGKIFIPVNDIPTITVEQFKYRCKKLLP